MSACVNILALVLRRLVKQEGNRSTVLEKKERVKTHNEHETHILC